MNITTFIRLSYWTCYFLEGDDLIFPTKNATTLLKCRNKGKYLAGSDLGGEYYGRTICILICFLIYIIGTFGVVTNVLNMIVLRKSLKGSSLKNLLIFLASLDLIACLFAIMFCTGMMMILDNVSRDWSAMQSFKVFHVLYSIGRTGSIYVTILVTIERYLVVAFPIKSKTWLSPARSGCYLGAVLLLTLFLNISWILNSTVGINKLPVPNNSTVSPSNFPYIFVGGTYFGKNIYPWLRYPQLILNYVAPFPLLFLFNGLLYRSIHNWNKNRQNLSASQKKEINAAKMFSIVVFILLLCHTSSTVIFFCTQFCQTVYRELMMLQVLSVTLSGAINFIVYYRMGKSFREEFRKLLPMAKWVPGRREQRVRDITESTQSSRCKDSSGSGADTSDDVRGEKYRMEEVDLNT